MSEIQIHPAAELFPMMDAATYALLLEHIREHGVQTCLKLVGDNRETAKLIDGRNRLRVIRELGLDPLDYVDVIHPDDLGDLVSYVLSQHLYRRHLSESQRAMVASKVAKLHDGQSPGAQIRAREAQSQAAKQLHVSRRSVQAARKVTEQAIPEIADAVERGEVSVSAAATVADLPRAEQQKLAAQGPKAVQRAAAKARKDKAEDSDSDVLFTLKRYWRRATKKDRSAFLQWVSNQPGG